MIDHDGSGLSLTGGGKTVELTDFEVDPGKSVLTGKVSVDGKVAAESAPLFFLDGRTLKPLETNDNGTAELEGTTVKLKAGGRGPAQSDVRGRRAEGRPRDRHRQDHRQHRASPAVGWTRARRIAGALDGPKPHRRFASMKNRSATRARTLTGRTARSPARSAPASARSAQRVQHRHVPQVHADAGSRGTRAARGLARSDPRRAAGRPGSIAACRGPGARATRLASTISTPAAPTRRGGLRWASHRRATPHVSHADVGRQRPRHLGRPAGVPRRASTAARPRSASRTSPAAARAARADQRQHDVEAHLDVQRPHRRGPAGCASPRTGSG